MRRIVLLILLVACKRTSKTAPPPDQPATGPPATGHSVTHLKGGRDGGTAVEGDAPAIAVDAPRPAFGGDGSPPHRDDEGHVHGPGGPVFMGAGQACDALRDHCMRDGTWFMVDNVIPGKIFRAVPVFEFENKWWDWRGEEQTPIHLFRTEVVSDTAKLKRGDQVIWFSADTDTNKWADSEYDALTSGRWESAVVADASGKTIRAKGWGDAIERDTARVIVESK